MAASFDAKAGSINNGFSSTVTKTFGHTCSGSNRLLVLFVDAWQDAAGTGVVTAASYNGVALTKLSQVAQGAMSAEIWYLIAPASGNNTVSVTFTGDHDALKLETASFNGIAQITPLDASNTALGSSGNPAVSLTTGVANALVVSTLSRFTTTAATTGNTSIYNDATGSILGAADYQVATTAGSYSDTYTGAAADDWAMVTASFKPATSSIITKTQGAVAHIKAIVNKNQTAKAAIKGVNTKTQPAISRISKSFTKTQTAKANIFPQKTKTQSAIAHIKTIAVKTQGATAHIKAVAIKLQTATARIAAPPAILKHYEYKVYRDGQFLGLLPNVTSLFNPVQDINTTGSQITISLAVSADISNLPSSTTIDDETGTPITDEAGNILMSDGGVNIIGLGTDTTLVKNGNKVVAIEYSNYHPNGKTVFNGEMENWAAYLGGDNSDEKIDILVYSDGQDMDNHLIQGSPLVLDQSQTSNNATYSLSEVATDKNTTYSRGAQTFVIGSGVTNLGAIGVYLLGGTSPIPCTLSVYNSVSDASIDNNVLASSTVAVSGTGAAAEVVFAFGAPIPVNPGDTYIFIVKTVVGQTMHIAYQSSSVYASGDMYISEYANGIGGSYTITPTSTIGSLSDLAFNTYSNAGQTTAVFTSEDPSNMLKSSMDIYATQGGLISYTSASIDLTALSLSYTFNTNTLYEALGTFLSLAPDGFYYYVDLGSNTLFLKQISSTPDIILTKGKHIDSMVLSASIENVKNSLYFIGGQISGSNLFRFYQDATSNSEYGVRLDRHIDNRVTLTSTANAIGSSYIAENKDEQFQTSVTVLDTQMDLTLLKPGQLVGFNGFGTLVDGLQLQIVRVSYSPDEATLTLGALPPRLNITLEQLTRNLLANATVNNPSSPS